MAGLARAHVLVAGIRDVLPASGVPDGGLEDALVLRGRVVLEEDVFDAPETSCCERGHFGTSGC